MAELARVERELLVQDDCQGLPDWGECTGEQAVRELLASNGQMTKDELVAELEDAFSHNVIETAIADMRRSGKIVGMGMRFKPAHWALAERGVDVNEIPGYAEEVKRTLRVKELYDSGHKRSGIARIMGILPSEVNNLRLRDGKVSVVIYDSGATSWALHDIA